jgi:hypothetical protein
MAVPDQTSYSNPSIRWRHKSFKAKAATFWNFVLDALNGYTPRWACRPIFAGGRSDNPMIQPLLAGQKVFLYADDPGA